MTGLDEIARAPDKIDNLGPIETVALHAQALNLVQRLLARSIFLMRPEGQDRLFGVHEAAVMLGHEDSWVYKHASKLPFVVREGRSIRCSLQGVQSYITERRGTPNAW